MTRRLLAAGAVVSCWALMGIAAPLAALKPVVPVDCDVGPGTLVSHVFPAGEQQACAAGYEVGDAGFE